jgi:uncharacterized lipoprotein YajG
MYRDVQDQTEEVERLETEIKHLEFDLKVQTSRIEELESNNVLIQRDLEDHIAAIKKQIMKYEIETKTNVSVLAMVSDGLLNLLKSVRFS